MGSWNGKAVTMTGTPEGDLLDGGTGNDWQQGTGEIDQLTGSDAGISCKARLSLMLSQVRPCNTEEDK